LFLLGDMTTTTTTLPKLVIRINKTKTPKFITHGDEHSHSFDTSDTQYYN